MMSSHGMTLNTKKVWLWFVKKTIIWVQIWNKNFKKSNNCLPYKVFKMQIFLVFFTTSFSYFWHEYLNPFCDLLLFYYPTWNYKHSYQNSSHHSHLTSNWKKLAAPAKLRISCTLRALRTNEQFLLKIEFTPNNFNLS